MALKTISYCILVVVLLQIRWATGSEILVSNVDELVAATQETADRLTIKLATGSYELSRQLVLKSGTKLIGAGIDKTFITHRSEWKASPKSLPDPEVRIQGLDSESYLIRMTDNSANVEVSGLTLIGPQVHGAIFGLRPKNFLMDHVKVKDVMWSGVRTLGMENSSIQHCLFVDAGGKWKRGGISPEERGGISGGALFLTWVRDCEIAHNRFQRTKKGNASSHFGIKGRQGKRVHIHHNTIDFGFSIEFPFEGDEDMEIDHNVLRGAVSIPKHAGGKFPDSGSTFHIHHNYFTTSYAIEFVRNGVEIDHNLFDFNTEKDGGNLISGFGKAGASGPASFHNNLVNNPGRGVIWINEPYNNFEIRNNHIVARTTATPRTEGLFAFNSETNFSTLNIRSNIVECIGQARPLLRSDPMYAAMIHNNLLKNVSDSERFSKATTPERSGLEEPLQFFCGADEEYRVDGWDFGKSAQTPDRSRN